MGKPTGMIWLAALILAAGLWTVVAAEEKGEAARLAEVPQAAQVAISKLAAQGEIKKIEKDEEDGKVVYEVQVTQAGKEAEFNVSACGKLLSIEEVVALVDVPEAVRKTFKQQAGEGEMGKVEKITEDGKIMYETKVTRSGKTLEIKVAPDGRLLGTEEVTCEKD